MSKATTHASVLEQRRRLAVARVEEGWAQVAVAAFLGVSARVVNAWVQRFRREGADGLKAKPKPGRPPKLTPRQEKAVLAWVAKSPTLFGYPDELWTSRRLAALIQKRLGVRFHFNYLVEWLAQRKHSPQKPAKRALERNEAEITRWVTEEWPRIQKKRGMKKPTLCSSTRAASS